MVLAILSLLFPVDSRIHVLCLPYRLCRCNIILLNENLIYFFQHSNCSKISEFIFIFSSQLLLNFDNALSFSFCKILATKWHIFHFSCSTNTFICTEYVNPNNLHLISDTRTNFSFFIIKPSYFN